MNQEQFVKKYLPNTIHQLLFSNKCINEIIDWISKFNKHTNKVTNNLLLIGKHGYGKTHGAYTIFTNLGYVIQNIDQNDLNNIKNESDIENSFIFNRSNNIVNMLNKNNKTINNVVLLIDNFELINTQYEKQMIQSILKINYVKKICPLVIISDDHHCKQLQKIQKMSTCINITISNKQSYINRVKYVLDQHNITFCKKDHKRILTMIVDFSQYDIRILFNVMYDIISIYRETILTVDIMETYFQNTQKKKIDDTLFDSVRYILENDNSINKSLTYFETEKSLIPLTIYEHYYKYIEGDINLIYKISELLADGDIIENYIHNYQIWELQYVYGIIYCGIVSNMLCKHKTKNNVAIKYPINTNKISLKNISKNAIRKIKTNIFNDANFNDINNISYILNHMLINNNRIDIMDIYKTYNITEDNFTKILKINELYNKNQSKVIKKILIQ